MKVAMGYVDYKDWQHNNTDADQYLSDFLAALASMNTVDFSYQYRKRLQSIERVFCYELYHRYKTFIDHNVQYYHGYRLDGEISKCCTNEFTSLGYDIIFTSVNPDMVLHHSQIDSSTNNQKLAIEVKSPIKNDNAIIRDIVKCYNYILNLNFNRAVFLMFNGDKEYLEKLLLREFHSKGNAYVWAKLLVLSKSYNVNNDRL